MKIYHNILSHVFTKIFGIYLYSEKLQNQPPNSSNINGATIVQDGDDGTSENPSKALHKPSGKYLNLLAFPFHILGFSVSHCLVHDGFAVLDFLRYCCIFFRRKNNSQFCIP
jgi:hypothetical protein